MLLMGQDIRGRRLVGKLRNFLWPERNRERSVLPTETPWLDGPDYRDLIRRKQHTGDITAEEAGICTTFAEEGFFVAERLIAPAQVDLVWTAYERFYKDHREEFFPSRIPGDPWPERYLNVHDGLPPIKEIMGHPGILRLTDMLFGRGTRPFQTIISHKGTEQPPHSDSIHMTTVPRGYLVAAWIAFEDIDLKSGPLEYYPGSHRLSYLLSEDVGIEKGEFQKQKYDVYKQKYQPCVQKLIQQHGLSPRRFLAGKGDVLFWHANLLHGGGRREDIQKSRKALVCHYFAEGVRCYHDLSGLPANFAPGEGSPLEPIFEHRTG